LPSSVVTEICSRALLGPSYSQEKSRPWESLGFVVVKWVPVICDAVAAGRAVQTLKFFTELAAPAFPVVEGVLLLDVAALDVPVLAGGTAAESDPPEHAVADAVTRMRLAAANTVDTRMFFSH
jgi:hypothetical protein